MSAQESILQAIDLFEERLREPVRVAEAAQAAGYSLYHFCRLFNQVTRLTPYEYLMRRRLSEAAQDLLQTRRKVLDIALDYQFGSSEAFGRAFQRMFGVLPSRMRLLCRLDPRWLLPRFTATYLAALAGLCLRPKKVHHQALELAGWMVPCTPGTIAFTPLGQRVADELRHAGSKGLNRTPPAEMPARYGMIFYPHDWQAQGCFCFAGTLADEAGDLAPLFVKANVQEQAYACFTCACPAGDLQFILEHLFHTWLPHSGLKELPDTVLFEKRGPSSWLIYLPVGTQQSPAANAV